MKRLLRRGVRRLLPEGYDVDTHFAPSYDPWDRRLCLVPDGDLSVAISAGDPRSSPAGSTRPPTASGCGPARSSGPTSW